MQARLTQAAASLSALLRAHKGLSAAAALMLLYPVLPWLDQALDATLGLPLQLERQLLSFFIFALLALALHVQVGLAGMMQLGVAAFFGIGAYVTGIATVEKFPFQLGFWAALLLAPAVGALAGAALGGLCARVDGDYLAMVTLGFAEVVRVSLLNMDSITDGSRGLNPLPGPWLPAWALQLLGGAQAERATFLPVYWVAAIALLVCAAGLVRLQHTGLGRAFAAMRSDPLATRAQGISTAKLRAQAMALGGAMAALAGALYATYLTTTAEPNNYDYNVSVMALCAVVLGGLGSVRGALLGALLVSSFDTLLSPMLSIWLGRFVSDAAGGGVFTSFAHWRWLLFGTLLVAMMRLRPQGMLGHRPEDAL